MTTTEDEYLSHIGIARRSGRYPWGSGTNPFQRSSSFKEHYESLRAQGLTDSQIAQGIEAHINAKENMKPGDRFVSFKTTDLRAAKGSSTEIIRGENQARATKLKDKGYKNGTIAEMMGLPRSAESTVRGWLSNAESIKENSIRATAEALKNHVAEKPFLDVGKGTELYMGIAATKLQTALATLRDEGYGLHAIKTPQLGTDKQTDLKVLTQPGVTWKEAQQAVLAGRLQNVTDHSTDGGLTYMSPKTMPVSVSSKRVEVRYKDDGGGKMDGIIQLRRGVEDLSLDGANYAQVRIAIDKTHFLKGMAMYTDDLPAGVDIRFNTNKTKASAPNKTDTMKPMKLVKEQGVETKKVDSENPFGATTYPRMYKNAAGKEVQSPLNIVGSHGSGNVEGRWNDWSRALSSQMLSKQSIRLASTQLNAAQAKKQADLDEINSLTNPVVKKKLLDEFADSADAAAVHLKAASLDRQTTAVLLPMNSMRPNEIYAPNHEHGEKLVLIRHPHGGPFEIPELTNNLRNITARRVLGAAKDAVGIHHTVADQLSGADFDGDTVLVIPNNTRAIKTRAPLAELQHFDAKEAYAIPKEDTKIPRMTKSNTQLEMGKISNLITDMSIHGANDAELARAVRHSMVVIDAEKHGLNYTQSAKDHNISELKKRYQGGSKAGAATIISRASKTEHVPEIKLRAAKDGGPVDVKTGRLVYVQTGNTKTTKTGEEVPRTSKKTLMELTKDARDLLSDKKSPQPMEEIYAAHANAMKAMANQARKTAHPERLRMPKQSKPAKALYAKEVASLEAKLKIAQRNAPLERKAQVIARAMARARINDDPTLDKEAKKKIEYAELERARLVTGASKQKIGSPESPITHREWEAIQASAVSASRLREILSNSDIERVKELATPRSRSSLTPGQMARARQLTESGRPLSEVAALLGIPRSTLSDNLGR